MKATKKIVGATCALVAAVALSAGSTFAWFAANGSVSAEGMKVTATAQSSLSIREGASGDYGKIVEFSGYTSAKELQPVTVAEKSSTAVVTSLSASTSATIGASNSIGFYTLYGNNTANNPDSAAATITMANAITADSVSSNFAEDTTKANYASHDLSIKYTGASSTSATVKMTVTISATTSKEIDKALHIGTLVGSAFKNYDACTTFTDSAYTLTVDSFVVLNAGETGEATQDFTVYVWYEGEDSDCTTKKAINANELSVSFTFEKV